MRFENIPGQHQTLRLRCPEWKIDKDGENPFSEFKSEVPVQRVSVDESRPAAFKVFAAGRSFSAVASSPVEARILAESLSRCRSLLARLLDKDASDGWNLEVVLFFHPLIDMGDLQIEFDESTERLKGREEDYLYEPPHPSDAHSNESPDDSYFFIKPGFAWRADDELRTEPEEIRNSSFGVFGDGRRFVASRQIREDGSVSAEEFFRASKATRWNQGREPDRTILLARGRFRLVEHAERMRLQARAQLDSLVRDEKSYLHRWDQFNELEGKTMLERARAFGAVRWSSARRGGIDGEGWLLTLDGLKDSVRSILLCESSVELELARQTPEWISRPEMTIADVLGNASANSAEPDEDIASGDASARKPSEDGDGNSGDKFVQVKEWEFDSDNDLLSIQTDTGALPNGGVVIFAFSGFLTSIQRRDEARRRIQAGASANPMLGTILESKGVPEPMERRKRVEPLSQHSRSLFKDPTDRQREAIDVALNTPDIALIQGPPGTGKTTVVTAILDRLNELSPKKGPDKGSVLLCGFQHDAVENMIERIRINSLPVPKFGKKRNSGPATIEQDSSSASETMRKEWCDFLASKIREENPQLSELEEERRIRDLVVQYVRSPSEALAKTVCQSILDLPPGSANANCRERAEESLRRMSERDDDSRDQNRAFSLIRGLRTTELGFRDDGPSRAADLADLFREQKLHLDEPDSILLRTASDWLEGDEMSFLPELKRLKRSLLVRFTAPPVFVVDKHSSEILSLARDTLNSIRETGLTAKDRRSAALLEFVESLEGDPDGMLHAVADYSFAFAATCQQCANWQIAGEKGVRRKSKKNTASTMGIELERPPMLEYDYVIVDEAARATPLDLLIPMSQGRRILLVGDHRQLPQMVDDELAAKLEDKDASKEEIDGLMDEKWWKESMFYYLFTTRIPELEARDGIKRRVTLDAQFRMHPLLGQFVSKNFYERFSPAERFDSPRPASDYPHGLPVPNGGPVLWIDVPAKRGNTTRNGGSLDRKVESEIISHKLLQWMELEKDVEDEKKLTYGVISFYRGQVEALKRRLGKLVDGKRLHVGTVDSFQGKEFDVVFLSLVRTSKFLHGDHPFGFLTVYNRLNVAMSRQKKLLVAVGDSAYVQNEKAKDQVPGLHAFFELCQVNGAVEEVEP